VNEVQCCSCKQYISTEEISAFFQEPGGGITDYWCIECRPPGGESNQIDDEDTYDGWLDPEDQYQDPP